MIQRQFASFDTYIFIDSRVLLRYRLVPDDVACRKAHHQVDVCRALGFLIDVMTQRMSFGEENLGEVVLLRYSQPCLVPAISYTGHEPWDQLISQAIGKLC
jgi:hypothetical protein